ncbi:hypothetical protein EEL32_11335 [Brevibacillus laterosporus]|nr:hypothetical protein [Brevibacillus laterosporus]RAP17740.1 hypothetical protein C2W64_04561 [Brevibacillus laterosporus]TPG87791.1 hypothetical protein EEL32_11335 [Brevibacillus laterosporus]
MRSIKIVSFYDKDENQVFDGDARIDRREDDDGLLLCDNLAIYDGQRLGQIMVMVVQPRFNQPVYYDYIEMIGDIKIEGFADLTELPQCAIDFFKWVAAKKLFLSGDIYTESLYQVSTVAPTASVYYASLAPTGGVQLLEKSDPTCGQTF